VFVRLLLLFTLVPLVELLLLLRVGAWVGLPATLVLVLGTGALGAWLARQQGLRTLHKLRQDLAEGRMPTERLVDGLLILIAGAVLLTPGLITDACGFFLLVPPGRAVVRRALAEWFQSRLQPPPPGVIDAQWQRLD
jgi:UPF0716 protein FxsA